MTMKPAIFLDRDGTLIEEVNYLSRVEELRLFPSTPAAVRSLKDHGFLVLVVTNQSGIGRGIFNVEAMHSIHEQIQVELDGAVDRFYFCPHLPCDGCICRKPKLGMIRAAQAEFEIDIERSWIVGDKKIDVETGQLAGLKTALVLTGYGSLHKDSLKQAPTLISDDLGSAAAGIIDSLKITL
jgi:D-glycero-D-manno-heptose 1,7-bisphosphate phosphatase